MGQPQKSNRKLHRLARGEVAEASLQVFPFTFTDDQTTHWFVWSREGVQFRSLQGHQDDGGAEIAGWIYRPDEPARRISQKPMPIHINLWLFKGTAPKNGREVEVNIHHFKFTAE